MYKRFVIDINIILRTTYVVSLLSNKTLNYKLYYRDTISVVLFWVTGCIPWIQRQKTGYDLHVTLLSGGKVSTTEKFKGASLETGNLWCIMCLWEQTTEMVCENDTIELGEERLQSDEIKSIGTLESIIASSIFSSF